MRRSYERARLRRHQVHDVASRSTDGTTRLYRGVAWSYRGVALSSLPSDFDLNAAWYRKAQGDLKAFMEAFAVRLEGAIPGRVAVERHKDGLFAKVSHATRITIEAHDHVYALELQKGRLAAHRSKAVRGVTLSTEAMEVPAWLDALHGDIQTLAEHAGTAQNVLHDFLMS
jgi:hypothetical protein